MNIGNALTRTGLFLKENSPAILTAFGVAGVGTTAYLTYLATKKSQEQIVFKAMTKKNDPEPWNPTSREIFDLTWKNYIPPVLVGVGTVSCIIGAQAVNARRQAALIGGYTFLERAFSDYKAATVEHVGEKKENEISEKVAQKRIEENTSREAVIISGDEYLCYDVLSDRYFKSDIERIRRAQNDINEQVFNEMYASLNEFYSKIGLATLPMGETMGWNTSNKLDLRLQYIPDPGGRPTLAIEFRNEPQMEYYKSVW